MKVKNKLTPWFPKNVNPLHIGVYEVSPDKNGPWYSHWNGKRWGWMHQDHPSFVQCMDSNVHDNLNWRGLAEKPA